MALNKFLLSILVLFLLVSTVEAGLTQNMSRYYSFDDDDVSGSYLADLTGNYDATFTATTGEAGVLGESFDLSGVDQYLNINETPPLHSNNFTINLWIYVDDISSIRTVYNFRNSTATKDSFAYLDTNGNMRVALANHTLGEPDMFATGWDATLSQWSMLTVVLNGTNFSVYQNATYLNSSVFGGNVLTSNINRLGLWWNDGNDFDGNLDEFAMYSRALSPSDISQLFNNGSSLSYGDIFSNILFVVQSPTNVDTSNVLDGYLNITYNYTNTTGLDNVHLNYTVTGDGDCMSYLNGSCFSRFNTTYRLNNVSYDGQFHNFSFYDVLLYPATFNYNKTVMENTAHSVLTIDNVGDAVLIEFLNVTNRTRHNVFSIAANKEFSNSSIAQVYYCNSSYSTGAFYKTPFCAAFATLNESDYDTCKNSSCHINKRLPIDSDSGTVNGVEVTSTSYVIVRSLYADGWNVSYISDSVRTGNSKTTSDNGSSWNNLAGTFDGVLYQFDEYNALRYMACGNNSDVFDCSANRSYTYSYGNFTPSAVNFSIPIPDENVSYQLNITYTSSRVNSGQPEYRIRLLNADDSFNKTLTNNNTNQTSYLWQHFKDTTIGIGFFKILVASVDTGSELYTYQVSELINITHDAVLNLTANNTLDGGIIYNFSGWVYDDDTGINTSYSTTKGYAEVGVIKGHNYTVAGENPNFYAFVNTTINISNEAWLTNYTFDLFTWNTIKIHILDYDTFDYISQTVRIVTISNLTSFINETSNGTIVIDFLVPNEYELRFNTTNYNSISKFITVLNNSAQNIYVYMTHNTTTELQVIQVLDTANQPVEGAVVWLQQEVINESSTQWVTIQEAITNSEGKTAVWVERDVTVFYRFAVIYNDEARPIQPSGNLFTTKTSFIPDVTETIQLIIEIEEAAFEYIEDLLGVSANCYFGGVGNDTYVFTWLDSRSTITGARLIMYGKYINETYDYVLLSNQTSNNYQGHLNHTVVVVNNTIYRAEAYILFTDRESLVCEDVKRYDVDVVVEKNTGLLYAALILVIVALLTVNFGTLICSVLAFLSLFLANIFHLVDIPISIVTGLIALAIIWFARTRKR